jgi:hypothetical protein
VALHHLLQQCTASRRAPGAVAGPQRALEGHATGDALGHLGSGTHGPGERAQHLLHAHAFLLQRAQDAQHPRCVAAEAGIDEVEGVEARAVGGGRHHLLRSHRLARVQQAQLLDVLCGRQQVPLTTLREQLGGACGELEAVPASAIVHPAHHLRRCHRPQRQMHARRLECREPLAARHGAVDPVGEDQQQQHVLAGARCVVGECLAAGIVQLLCNPDLEYALGGEEGQRVAEMCQLTPVEASVGVVHDALLVALRAGGAAQRVHRFLALQRLLAADDVDGCERVLEVLGQLFGTQAHGC